MSRLSCFKAYDVRGKVPEEVNNDLAYKIGHAFTAIIKPHTVVVGYDVRLESPELSQYLIQGLVDAGTNVILIGQCGTEEVYFHTYNMSAQGIGGGIMITASHNPKGYNGMKMVGMKSRPISLEDDLQKIHDYVLSSKTQHARQRGSLVTNYDKSTYISCLLSLTHVDKLKPLKIVVNPGNGPAGSIIKLLENTLPFQFIYINGTADGNFPNGVPNPMIPANRVDTAAAVINHGAVMGIAWDGDFDRCFFTDEQGRFIENYYIIGLFAEYFLCNNANNANESIIHDTRLIWNTLDIVSRYNGYAIPSKSGHSFMKEKMRSVNAIYGGEMSGHHYFRNFGYCDSGMIPWLLVAELLSTSQLSLSQLVQERINAFPCSGEINYHIDNVEQTIKNVIDHFAYLNPIVDFTDGICLEFNDWRMNLRQSNTESVIRLNIEVRNTQNTVGHLVREVENIICRQIEE